MYVDIKGATPDWFKSCPSDKSQFVHVNDKSSLSRFTCGEPQGSVLGPVLFAVCFQLEKITRHHGNNFHFYADDTELCLRSINPDDSNLSGFMARQTLFLDQSHLVQKHLDHE